MWLFSLSLSWCARVDTLFTAGSPWHWIQQLSRDGGLLQQTRVVYLHDDKITTIISYQSYYIISFYVASSWGAPCCLNIVECTVETASMNEITCMPNLGMIWRVEFLLCELTNTVVWWWEACSRGYMHTQYVVTLSLFIIEIVQKVQRTIQLLVSVWASAM